MSVSRIDQNNQMKVMEQLRTSTQGDLGFNLLFGGGQKKSNYEALPNSNDQSYQNSTKRRR